MTPISLEELKGLIVDLTSTVRELAQTVGDLRVDVATLSTQQNSLAEWVEGMEKRFNERAAEVFGYAHQTARDLKDHKKANSASHTRLKLDMARQIERTGLHKDRWKELKGFVLPLLSALITGIVTYLLTR